MVNLSVLRTEGGAAPTRRAPSVRPITVSSSSRAQCDARRQKRRSEAINCNHLRQITVNIDHLLDAATL
jgi:hypothetical protein